MLKVTTWNVNGVRARKDELPAWLESQRPDVVCLQEIKASPEQVPDTLRELPDYWSYWHGHKGYSGVALLLSKTQFVEPPTFSHPAFDHETRIVVARANGLSIASIYVPNGGKDFEAKLRFLDALERYTADMLSSGEKLLLCGDLNVAREERDVHPSLQKRDQIGTTPDERAQFARILGHGLSDLGRKFEPDNDRLFTWWAPWRNMREKNVGWRIDYVLAEASLAERATSCEVSREFGKSDHAPLTVTFDVAV
jgi:exodeoxyribonuclease-3